MPWPLTFNQRVPDSRFFQVGLPPAGELALPADDRSVARLTAATEHLGHAANHFRIHHAAHGAHVETAATAAAEPSETAAPAAETPETAALAVHHLTHHRAHGLNQLGKTLLA